MLVKSAAALPHLKTAGAGLLSWTAAVLLTLGFAGAPAHAARDSATAPGAVWEKVKYSLFPGAEIQEDKTGQIIKLETPARAMDAAIVPIAIRSQIEQTADRYIDKIWLVVDNNPSPVGAEFTLSPDSGRADIETRIRIEEYTNVRAVARLNDGSVHVVTNYVKAAGGCSAPARSPSTPKLSTRACIWAPVSSPWGGSGRSGVDSR